MSQIPICIHYFVFFTTCQPASNIAAPFFWCVLICWHCSVHVRHWPWLILLCRLPAVISSLFMSLQECVLCFWHISSSCTFFLSVDLQYLSPWWLLKCNTILCQRVIQCFISVLYLVIFLYKFQIIYSSVYHQFVFLKVCCVSLLSGLFKIWNLLPLYSPCFNTVVVFCSYLCPCQISGCMEHLRLHYE